MRVTGTLFNYYFLCKRKCYLYGNNISMESESELVKIGKALHESKRSRNPEMDEIVIDGIRIDSLTDTYVIERKKSSSNAEAARWQLLFYLKKLKDKGVIRKGKLEFFEKEKNSKVEIIELTEEIEKEVLHYEKEIAHLILSEGIPKRIDEPGCKKCAYFEYCYI